MFRKSPGEAPGAPGEVPGSYSESSGEAPGGPGRGKSRLASGNGEKLENDENAVFLESRGVRIRAKTGASKLTSRGAVDGRL